MNPAGDPNRPAPKLRSGLDGSLTEIGAGLTVGREPDCGLCIPQGVVSRLHARIGWRDGGLWIEDPGSTNGTYVNGQRIEAATELHEGDQIAFDTLTYQLIDLAAPVDRDRTVLGRRALQPEQLAAAAGAGAGEIGTTAPVPPPAPESAAAATPAATPTPAAPPAPIAMPAPATPPAPAPSPTPAAADSAAAPVAVAFPPPSKPTPSPAPPTAAPPPPKPTPPPPSRDDAAAAGIPASWAESAQLENASHTMMMPAQLLNALAQSKVSTRAVIAAVRAESGRARPVLVGLTSGVAGQVFLLDPAKSQGQWEIGRNREADIRIDDNSVSGRHAQVLCNNGRWKLVNLMSINGSFVNERKVLSAHLNTGDRIRLGNVELAFDAGGELPRGGDRDVAGGSGRGAWLASLWHWLRERWRG